MSKLERMKNAEFEELWCSIMKKLMLGLDLLKGGFCDNPSSVEKYYFERGNNGI
jgi:hypothetical protein